jgi:hypothetical protein
MVVLEHLDQGKDGNGGVGESRPRRRLLSHYIGTGCCAIIEVIVWSRPMSSNQASTLPRLLSTHIGRSVFHAWRTCLVG